MNVTIKKNNQIYMLKGKDCGGYRRTTPLAPQREEKNGKRTQSCFSFTAGPGSLFPELTESTPAETKIVTIVLPSCIILKL
jgi:hypothetical protein